MLTYFFRFFLSLKTKNKKPRKHWLQPTKSISHSLTECLPSTAPARRPVLWVRGAGSSGQPRRAEAGEAFPDTCPATPLGKHCPSRS